MSLETGIPCFDETPWIQEGAGRVKIAKWKWYEFQDFSSEKKEIYVLGAFMKHYKEWRRKERAKFAFFFFSLQPKLEILCYYTHLIQILSGFVPKREKAFSVKLSHQKTLEAVQITGFCWAEHMLMW